MLPGFNIADFANQFGPLAAVLIIAAIIFAESGLLIGFFLPGDSLLFTAGFLTLTGVLHFDIHLLVVIVFVAAVIGDGFGYLFGRRIGHRIFNRPNSLIFRKENIEKAEAFYEKHGPFTIVLARFTPIVRTFAPIVAGVAKMPYRTFLIYNLIGGFLWATSITYLGYYAGAALEQLGFGIDTIILPAVIIIVFISIAPPAIHILRDKKQRQALWQGTKKQFRLLFIGDK